MNSVQLELIKLDKLWSKTIKQTPSTPLYVCLGEKQELKLFEAYFDYQNSDASNTQHIFISLKYNFDDIETYGQEFINDWSSLCQIKEQKEGTEEWNKNHLSTTPLKGANLLLDLFYSLYTAYPEIVDKKIFILLAPANLNKNNIKSFEQWISQWCSCNKKLREIKLVVMDNVHHPFLKLPPNKHPFKMDIDMANLMSNVAGQTNKEKGSAETNFQQQIVLANDLLSKGLYDNAFVSLEKAIKIAKSQHYTEGECTARFMIAGIFLALEKPKKAEDEFNKIFNTVEKNTLLEAEMYMNYAGLLLSQSESAKAIKALEKAIDIAEHIDHKFIQIECYRMIGQFSDNLTSFRTVACYEKVIELSEELDLTTRRSGTLAYTAVQLLKKYGHHTEKAKQLNQKMIFLLGQDWRQLAQEPVLSKNNQSYE